MNKVEIHSWKAFDEKWKLKGADLSTHSIVSGAESFLAGIAGCRIEVQGMDELSKVMLFIN